MPEKKAALIVANWKYEDADLRQLVAPANDAEALARVLRDQNICGFEVTTLLNRPSREACEQIERFFLDCRYSGEFASAMLGKGDKSAGVKDQFEQGRGMVVMTASDALQYSFEGDSVAGEPVNSIFTRVLVKGIESGEADHDRDGTIS